MPSGNPAPTSNTAVPNVPPADLCSWGPQCPVCAKSAPHPEPANSGEKSGKKVI